MLPRLLPRAALLAGLALLPFVASAQRMVLADPKAEPVVVDTAAISTEITGRLAVTTFDLTFRNPNARPLEGTFEFPLLEGQSIVRFALDIGGALREAVPVEKEKGRIVFEEIERRRVDPGLLEQTAGNNYRARVFPLPAGGTRRIVVAYQEDLGHAAIAPRYRLALDFPGQLARFNLRLTVHTAGGSPAIARTTLPLELPAWENAQLLTIERSGFDARGVLELDLPRIAAPALITQRLGDREYFYGELPVGAIAPAPRPAPKAIGLLWDASSSGRERDHAREFALLDAWFAEVRDVEVHLIALRDTAAAMEKFTIRAGNWTALRAVLEKTIYDGATSFDGLADDSAVQEWLLFSDGLFNYGTTSTLVQLPLQAPVHAIVASPRADPIRLRGLSARSHGEFINLLEVDALAGARRLRTASFRVLAVERDPEAVAQVFPEVGALLQEEVLVVTGLLRRPTATVRLKLGHTDADARTVELVIRSGAEPSQLAARAWASAKIAALSLDPEANREDIKRTSQEFGIVTAGTSLIVLETLADYIRYDITPPEELRAEWTARNRTRADAFQKSRANHLDQIARQFAERIQWWKKEFPKDTRKEQPSDDKQERTLGLMAPSEGVDSGARSVRRLAREASSNESGRYSALESLAGSRAPVPAAVHASAPAGGDSDSRTYGALRFDPGTRYSETGERPTPDSTIALNPWQPTAGYLERLRRTATGERYAIYLEERSDHRREPGFYLDVAGFFLDEKDHALGLRILSNLAELGLEDAALLRVLGHRLVQAGHPELALPLFEHVLRIRGEEPQSRRDLALVCAAVKQNQRAVDLLWEVVAQPWDGRFPDIELIAAGELNAIAATCGEKLDLAKVDARLRENLPVGLRAVLTWDADSCDIDLWLDDPNGERAMYNHPLTYQGGRMSRDFTGGYGPEEFLLRDPKPGKYTVRINYYGDRRQAALGPVTAQVRLITGFGTPAQKEQRLTVRLAAKQETLEIGTIEIGQP